MILLSSRAIALFVVSAILACLVVAQVELRTVEPTRVISQFPHTLTGDIRLHEHFHSNYLAQDRNIIVYLPPGYDSERRVRYPVLYMQDGENIFDAATSFFLGMERHIDEKAQRLITGGTMQPVIIVGIYSSGRGRIKEYTPAKMDCSEEGGAADLYGQMLVKEIKPFIDEHYRTLSSVSNTALAGSSLGGLVTMYLGLKYADTFGKLAVTSPAAFFDDEMIVRYVHGVHRSKHQRIWLSVGTGELPSFIESTRSLHQALVERGWRDGRNLSYVEANQQTHNPKDWSKSVDGMLLFLFPAAGSSQQISALNKM